MAVNAQSADEILRLAYDSTNVALKVNITVLDNKRLKVGTDGDVSLVLNSAGLAANTALANVLIGTPVTPAIAADSLIIANATANGDILIAGNDGGHSRVAMFFDTSAPDTILYNVGGTWSAGATTWTVPAVTLGGVTTLAANMYIVTQSGILACQATTDNVTFFYGGTNVAGYGARILAGGKTWSAGNGAIWLETPNAAGNADITRLVISGVAATAVATWANVTHTGLNITATLAVAGTQVIGARVVDARADDVVDSTYGAEEAGVLDALRDAMITHGLIAAA